MFRRCTAAALIALGVVWAAPGVSGAVAPPDSSSSPPPIADLGPTIVVTSAAPTGEGSLAAAFEAASLDPDVRRITVSPELAGATIDLSDTLSFTGQQSLVLDGAGVTLQAAEVSDALHFATSADITVRNLAVESATGMAMRFDIAGSERAARLRLFDIDVRSSNAGIIVDDERGGGNGVYLVARRVGVEAFVGGTVVRSEGTPVALDLRNAAIEVVNDALVVAQRGAGAANVKLLGLAIGADETGVSITESGDGRLRVDMANVSVESLFGPTVLEGGRGDLLVNVTNTVLDVLTSGFTAIEGDAGSLRSRFRSTTVRAAGAGIGLGSLSTGLDVEQRGAGRFDLTVSRLELPDGAEIGVRAQHDGAGRARLRVVGSSFGGSPTPLDTSGISRVFEANNA